MKKIFLLPFIALVSFSNVFAQTSDWPNKPVKIVVPFTPGGALDLTARELAKRLSTKYNQSFLVENLPGAGGTVGVNAVVKSKPDGYTLLVASTGQLSLQPAIYKNLPYDPATDLKAISQLTSAPFILVVSSEYPGKTAKDLSADLKANPKKYNYTSTGNGTLVHLTGEMFSQASGANATHVSYKGGPESVLAVASKDALYTLSLIHI